MSMSKKAKKRTKKKTSKKANFVIVFNSDSGQEVLDVSFSKEEDAIAEVHKRTCELLLEISSEDELENIIDADEGEVEIPENAEGWLAALLAADPGNVLGAGENVNFDGSPLYEYKETKMS